MIWLKKQFRSIVQTGIDFALPPVCLSCHDATDTHATLCPKCWKQVDFIISPICDRLGTPLSYDIGGSNISAAALASPPLFDRCRSVGVFEGPLQRLIHAFKYADRHEGLQLFGKWMAFAGKDILHDADLLIPVPLNRWRLWSRRFNQSSLLAHTVSKRCGVPVHDFLIKRVKLTKSQVGLTKKQRVRNVSGAFVLPKSKYQLVENKNVVLIDDVFTTGATITACTKVLKRAKASRVDVLTLARVVKPHILDP